MPHAGSSPEATTERVGPARGPLTSRLPYRRPYDATALLAFLGARAIPGVELVERGAYRRTVALGDAVGWMEVAAQGREAALCLTLSAAVRPFAFEAVARAGRLFDVRKDPRRVAARLASDPLLARLQSASPGVRVPGAWDPFELAVRAVLGQQVSVAAARTLVGRLVARFGTPIETGRPLLTHLFPGPAALAAGDLASIGLPASRARTLSTLAELVAEGRLSLAPGRSLKELVECLTAVPGIGPWTAQYIALRAFNEADAFPAGDLVLRKALGTGGRPLSEPEAERRSRAWSPFRAYAAVLLWRSAAGGKAPPPRTSKESR